MKANNLYWTSFTSHPFYVLKLNNSAKTYLIFYLSQIFFTKILSEAVDYVRVFFDSVFWPHWN